MTVIMRTVRMGPAAAPAFTVFHHVWNSDGKADQRFFTCLCAEYQGDLSPLGQKRCEHIDKTRKMFEARWLQDVFRCRVWPQ